MPPFWIYALLSLVSSMKNKVRKIQKKRIFKKNDLNPNFLLDILI